MNYVLFIQLAKSLALFLSTLYYFMLFLGKEQIQMNHLEAIRNASLYLIFIRIAIKVFELLRDCCKAQEIS